MESERVRATAHYVWKDADTLGCGSFGMVFRGSSKEKGEPVAVKTLLKNRSTHGAYEEQHDREIQLLQNINHRNVVKLIAVEEEMAPNGAPLGTKVLILELADTTLYHELERPENMFGLRDDAFLLLLGNVASGLEHLRTVHHILHRDLKPSNILKTVDATGMTVYKLCDFGGARTIANDEEPMYSLVGTPEYLHPRIHEGVIKGVELAYTASCDLWSIGATLYQAATAKLPFMPSRGARNDRLLMLHMTQKKPTGAISGCQNEQGSIDWSRQLPISTQLSEGLRPRVTAMLGGLMESSRTEQWTYERFFFEVTRMTRAPPIKLLHFNQAKYIYIYEASFDEFAAEFKRQLNATVDEYLFWTGEKLLLLQNSNDLTELSGAIQPIFFSKDAQCEMPNTLYLPCSRPKFPPVETVEINDLKMDDLVADVDAAKRLAGLGHFSREETLKALTIRAAVFTALGEMRNAFDAKSIEVERRIEECKKLWKAIRRQIDPVGKCSKLTDHTKQHLNQCVDSANLIHREMNEHESMFNQIKTQVMAQIIRNSPPPLTACHLEACMDRSTKAIDDILMQFKKEKGLYTREALTYNEKQWHRIAKERLKTESQGVLQLMKDEKQRLKNMITHLATPFKVIATDLDRLNGRFLSEIQDTAAMIDGFQDTIAQVVLEHFSDDHETPSVPPQPETPVVPAPSVQFQSCVSQTPDFNASMQDLLSDAVQFREMTQQTAELMKSYLQM